MKKTKQKLIKSEQGSVLIEIIITLGIVVVLISTTINLILTGANLKYQIKQKNHAILIAKEMSEIAGDIKNNNWQDIHKIVNQGKYHPIKNGNEWKLIPGEKKENNFISYIVVEEVKRNATGRISNTGSTDQEIIKVTSSVEWKNKTNNKKINLNTLLTNWQN